MTYTLLIFLIVTGEKATALSTNIEQVTGFNTEAVCEKAGEIYLDSDIGSYFSNKEFVCLPVDSNEKKETTENNN